MDNLLILSTLIFGIFNLNIIIYLHFKLLKIIIIVINYMSFIFKLPYHSGGYCNQLWHLIGYYLYSKKNNLEFILDDSVWPWKNNKGWDDYFNSNFKLLRNVSSLKTPVFKNPNWENTGYLRPEINIFTLSEYKNMFKNIMILNESLKNKLNDIMVKFNLEPKNFDSIMIEEVQKCFSNRII